jgi:hypothetical protein
MASLSAVLRIAAIYALLLIVAARSQPDGGTAPTSLPAVRSRQNQFFWIALGSDAVLVITAAGLSFLLWNRPETFHIHFVPAPVLIWGFIGAMTAVLYRSAFEGIPQGQLETAHFAAGPIRSAREGAASR